MTHVTQLRFLARSLATKPGIPVAGRGVRVIAVLLAVEVVAVIIVARTVLGLVGLHRRTPIDQRTVIWRSAWLPAITAWSDWKTPLEVSNRFLNVGIDFAAEKMRK